MIKPLVRNLLEKFLLKMGYRLTPGNLYNWSQKDTEFKEIFNMQRQFGWSEDTGPKIQRMYMVKNLLTSIKGLDGNWAECGVFKGSTSLVMAEYNKRYNLLKNDCAIHLFDSFEGLSNPGDADAGTSMNKGDYYGGEKEVKNNLSAYDYFVYHKGWIPERFPDVSDMKFAFVHIDVDFYEPVRDSLDFFIPRMAPGGIIVLDDYGCEDTPGALQATDEMAEKYGHSVAALPYGQAFIRVN